MNVDQDITDECWSMLIYSLHILAWHIFDLLHTYDDKMPVLQCFSITSTGMYMIGCQGISQVVLNPTCIHLRSTSFVRNLCWRFCRFMVSNFYEQIVCGKIIFTDYQVAVKRGSERLNTHFTIHWMFAKQMIILRTILLPETSSVPTLRFCCSVLQLPSIYTG